MSDRIEKFVEAMHIQPHERILEIGCGHGVAASLICEKLATGHYVGIDRSPKMVAAATKRNAAFVSAGLATFVVATLESYDPGQARFDKVLAMRVRLFHDRPEEAGRLAERWLAPGGKLFVQYDEPGGG
ncbi:class I SAM-dependent methyltransferase [Pseudoduganella chitinolytica]|uniref:Class I SAM-dependent methyltransferase n=1 Tax=Pseudoduganella chitinolytica TaxID=34070 RepID=A0ABY8BFB5_9BURK|nr:class I SAM-dependent methyltransferase [Pseudoduganella chitinolytica]WEF34376.1 class I SAM-dependent methyltransferase [Pseudoduganella chitinolytica]